MQSSDKFVALVAEMRAAQKDFYKDRTRWRLMHAKALEGRVDKELKRKREERLQPKLF